MASIPIQGHGPKWTHRAAENLPTGGAGEIDKFQVTGGDVLLIGVYVVVTTVIETLAGSFSVKMKDPSGAVGSNLMTGKDLQQQPAGRFITMVGYNVAPDQSWDSGARLLSSPWPLPNGSFITFSQTVTQTGQIRSAAIWMPDGAGGVLTAV